MLVLWTLVVLIPESENWQSLPALHHATFHHALIACLSGVQLLKCITIGIHLILLKAMRPRISQWQSLFS